MSGRGSGKTTAQLLALPHGALFIVQNERHADYTRCLAASLGRRDIEVQTWHWIESMRWRGRTWSAMSVDHSARGTDYQEDMLREAFTRVRPT